MRAPELVARCRRIADLKLAKEKASAIIKKADAELAALYMEASDGILETKQDNWRVPGVGLFSPTWPVYLTVTDQEKLQTYLKKHKLSTLIQVQPNTISEWGKSEMEKMKEANKKFVTDSVALARATMKQYGFSFYERARVGFSQREGKYKKTKEEE